VDQLLDLVQLLASVYPTSILFVLVDFGLIARLFGRRVLKIIRYFEDELLIAFSDGGPDTDAEPLDEPALARPAGLRASLDRVGYRGLASRVGGASR
jgi:hypothetical protein